MTAKPFGANAGDLPRFAQLTTRPTISSTTPFVMHAYAASHVSRIVFCNHMGYTHPVAIKGFRHKGLERFFATGSKQGIQAKHADRLRLVLGRLNAAAGPRDMALPGLDLHKLQGARKGTWAVKVSGNWRVTFGFAGKDAQRVDYEDYH